jgi:hypothetical protein
MRLYFDSNLSSSCNAYFLLAKFFL